MEGGGRFSSCAPCSNPALYVRIGTLVSGALLIGSAVFRIIRLFVGSFDDPEFFVLLIWVAVFGVLLILAELDWPSCMAAQFGYVVELVCFRGIRWPWALVRAVGQLLHGGLRGVF